MDEKTLGRCNREKPPCKYFHPPQHLKDQLLINGRNHLALKNAIMQQMGISPGQPVLPGQVPAVATNPYLASMPASTYSPYFPPGHLMPTLLGPADPSQLGPVVQQAVVPQAQQKIPRSDRLESNERLIILDGDCWRNFPDVEELENKKNALQTLKKMSREPKRQIQQITLEVSSSNATNKKTNAVNNLVK